MTLDSMPESPAPPPPPPPPPGGRSRRTLYLVLGGVAVLALAGGGIAAWALLRDGGSAAAPGPAAAAASAEAVPADAQVYASLDLAVLPDVKRLVDAFEIPDAAGLGDELGLGDGLGDELGLGQDLGGTAQDVGRAQDLMTCVGDGLALDLENLPAWVGDEAGIALLDMELDAVSGDVTDPRALVVIDVADQAAAEAYLPEILAAVEPCLEVNFEETTYAGVTVHSAERVQFQSVAIALTEGRLLFALGDGTMEQALDLGTDGALAADPGFAAVMAAMPADRDLSAYIGSSLIEELASAGTAAAGDLPEITLPESCGPIAASAEAGGMGLAMTMAEEGVRLDIVGAGQAGEAAGEEAPALESPAPSALPGLLPADAIGFVGTGPFDVPAGWDCLQGVIAQMPAEEGQPSFEDSMRLIGFMLGIDLENDLIGQLTGEMGIGLLPATAGTLAEQSGVNLGIIAVLGVEDPAAMAGTAESMAQGIAQMSETPASPREFAGGTLYALSDGLNDIMLFGMAGDYLVVTTHESHAAALLAGGPRLEGSARYAQALGGLPEGSLPIMYVDMAAVIAALDLEEDEAAAIAPMQTMAMGMLMDGGIMRMTMYAIIDY